MLKRNLIYNFILSLSQVIIPLITIPYLSRVLNPSGIGQVGFMDSYTGYFISLAEFGIMVYGIREVARTWQNKQVLRSLVGELLTLHLVSSILSFGIYLCLLTWLWDQVSDRMLIYWSMLGLLVNFLACEWFFIGSEKFAYIATRSLLIRFAGVGLIFLLVRKDSDFVTYYAIISGSAILTGIMNFWILFREFRPAFFESKGWKKHIRSTFLFYLIGLSFGITLLLDNVFLRISSTVAAVGFYTFAVKVVRIGSGLLTDNLLVFFPRTVGLIEEKNDKGAGEILTLSAGILFLLAIPFSFGVFLYSEWFTTIYFGERFLPVALNLRILSIYPLLHALGLFLNKQVLMSFGQERKVLYSLLAGGFIFIPLTLILSYFYADPGASIALIIVEILILLLNLNYSRPFLVSTRWLPSENLWHPIIASIIFIPVWWLMDRFMLNPLVKLLTGVIISFLLYGVTMIWVLRNKLARKIFETINPIPWESRKSV